MGLLNYSTRIPAAQTAGEVQRVLAQHGAKRVMIEYGDDGGVESLSFQIMRGDNPLAFSLPVEPQSVLKVLERQHGAGQLRSHQGTPTYEQAVRVAWRILKDWVEAQMAILETEMVTMEQIFLPYLITGGQKTLYQMMIDRGFYLTEGKG